MCLIYVCLKGSVNLLLVLVVCYPRLTLFLRRLPITVFNQYWYFNNRLSVPRKQEMDRQFNLPVKLYS
jgi:hypothetical protein